MPKKPFDANEDPPGGRAAERLREFEEARGIVADETDQMDEASQAGDLGHDESDAVAPCGEQDPVPPASQAIECVTDNTEDD